MTLKLSKNLYLCTLLSKKKLVEYYDQVKDPIKIYFMDKL